MRLSNYSKLTPNQRACGIIFGVAALFLGCNSGTQRTETAGSGAEVLVGSSGDAAPADKVPLSPEGGGNGSGSGGGSQLTGKSLEQCTAEKKAWRAVVDSGKAPSECTEALVSWCCTRGEVLARFPTAATKLETEFSRYIDSEKHVLYHCSTDGVNRTTFHMAKVEGARVFYRTLYIEKSFPVDTGNSGSCPVVTTKDLSTASVPPADEDQDEDGDAEDE